MLHLAVQNCKDQWDGDNKSLESWLISRKKLGNVRKGSCAPCLESASRTPLWHGGPCGSGEVTMFWQLLPGVVVGGQAHEVVPLTSEEWKAMKTQFDMKTGRTWPNLEPSERAKITRDYVLRQFCLTFVDDRLDFGNTRQTKSVFFLRCGSDGHH